MENLYKIIGYKTQLIGDFLLLREIGKYDSDSDNLRGKIMSSNLPKKLIDDITNGRVHILVMDAEGNWDGVKRSLVGWVHLRYQNNNDLRVKTPIEAIKIFLMKKSQPGE